MPVNWRKALPRRMQLAGFDAATGLLVCGVAAVALLTVRQYGISNDEEVQHRYGELIVRYYASGFADRAVFGYKNLYLYGGLFDVVAVGLAHVIPADLYLLRHVMTIATGIGGFAAVALTARLIAGPRAGFFAAATLAVCGVWFGGQFNHTKDIPFAAAMSGAVYFLLLISRTLPRPRPRDVAGFGILLGAALGLRAIGLLLLGYAGVAILLAAFRSRDAWRDRVALCAVSILMLLPAVAIGYVIMAAAWPWAALAPLNPIRAIIAFGQFQYQIHTIIAGTVYEMADVPWWYVPGYLLIKLPIVMLAGALAALALARGGRWHEPAFVGFVAVFPVLCIMIVAGPAFTGMRHFLFVVPPLAVLSGLGLDALVEAVRGQRRWLRGAVAATIAAGLLWPATVLVRLHPYEYLYYNKLIDGLPGASRRYEMDYWLNFVPEAVDALQAYVKFGDPGKDRRSFTVAFCGEWFAFRNYADRRFQLTGHWNQADFFIAPTHMDCDRAVGGKIIATIERLGVPIGVVKDRRMMIAQPVGETR